jgi:hypothetical protein
MKGFVKSILIFAVFSSMFYMAGILALGYAGISALHLNFKFLDTPSRSLLRVQDIQQIDTVDILFLGSSRAFKGFDTRIFNEHGYSAFNFGTSAQTPVQTAMLLDRYLDGIAPRLVVYEVYPEGFESDGVESAIDLLSSDRADAHAWKMMKEVSKPTVSHALFFALWQQSLGKELRFTDRPDGYLPMSGYIQRPVTYNVAMDMVFPHQDIEIRDYQWAAFERIVKKFRERNIRLIMVQAPVPSSRYDAMTNRDSIHELLRNQGEFIAFNEILALDDSLHFEDDSHLNQIGAELFNARLIELLSATSPSNQQQLTRPVQ